LRLTASSSNKESYLSKYTNGQIAQSMDEIAPLLERLRNNDRAAVDQLFSLFYDDLRRMAQFRLASHARHTQLDTGLLVHEAYLRFSRVGELQLADRAHFLAYAASTLRSVVVDFIRRRNAEQRGGGTVHVTLNTEVAQSIGNVDEEILEVHEALVTLAAVDSRLAQVVEMRYFAGISETDIAAALGVSERTVRRDWERARLLLAELLSK
jgi:RNA polymerase sigma factor (TIGR02999 family)